MDSELEVELDAKFMTVGQAIMKMRVERGISVRAVARAVHTEPSHISRVERDQIARPNFQLIVHICRVLDVSTEELAALVPSEYVKKGEV